MSGLQIVTCENHNPFGAVQLVEHPAGETLAEIVDAFGPSFDSSDIVVTIDGRRVEAEVWVETVPAAGEIVAISAGLGGDGVVKLFAQIAIIAAAAAATVLIPGLGVFEAAWANSLLAAGVAGGIPLAGNLETDALRSLP
jgi:hypothetical protein